LYDGPFCVLSAVDARRQRRLLYEVLDHDPTQVDILSFLARLNDLIRAHGQHVRGITTDASPLYPLPVALALGDVPHQVCEFHILKELTRGGPAGAGSVAEASGGRNPEVAPRTHAEESQGAPKAGPGRNSFAATTAPIRKSAA
jgi:hypothetical protein